jgi:hypothetical protein
MSLQALISAQKSMQVLNQLLQQTLALGEQLDPGEELTTTVAMLEQNAEQLHGLARQLKRQHTPLKKHKKHKAQAGAAAEEGSYQGREVTLPSEVLVLLFSHIDSKTLLTAVPGVCKQWRAACPSVKNVDFNFAWSPDFSLRRRLTAPVRPFPVPLSAIHGLSLLFKHVTSVTFCKDNQVGDEHIIALANHSNLTSINVQRCTTVTDAAVLVLAEQCIGLTSVNFGGCTKLTDASMVPLAQRCPALTSVNVAYCHTLSDAFVVALAQHARGLASFNAPHLRLTDAALVALATKCHGLIEVDVS